MAFTIEGIMFYVGYTFTECHLFEIVCFIITMTTWSRTSWLLCKGSLPTLPPVSVSRWVEHLSLLSCQPYKGDLIYHEHKDTLIRKDNLSQAYKSCASIVGDTELKLQLHLSILNYNYSFEWVIFICYWQHIEFGYTLGWVGGFWVGGWERGSGVEYQACSLRELLPFRE